MGIRSRIRKILFGVSESRSVPETEKEDAVVSKEPKVARHELILYGRNSCPYCRFVTAVINKLDIDHLVEHRLTTYGSEWREDLSRRTGRTQVPCLFIDGEELFESDDIIDWLVANYS